MTVIQLIKETEDTYQKYLKAGLISTNVNFYKRIYDIIEKEINTGKKKMEAYRDVADNERRDVSTICRAIRMMDKKT